jgi:hypothetical protein
MGLYRNIVELADAYDINPELPAWSENFALGLAATAGGAVVAIVAAPLVVAVGTAIATHGLIVGVLATSGELTTLTFIAADAGVAYAAGGEMVPSPTMGPALAISETENLAIQLEAKATAKICPKTNVNVPNPLPQFLEDGVTPNRGPAAWVNTIDDDGIVRTHSSSPGRHAEVNAQAVVPGAPMSSVWGWRGPKGAEAWREIPICTGCQGKFPQSMFPANVKADPDGPWGRK